MITLKVKRGRVRIASLIWKQSQWQIKYNV